LRDAVGPRANDAAAQVVKSARWPCYRFAPMTDSNRRIDVQKVAALARLELSTNEVATMQPQLARVLDYIATLDELDTADVAPTSHVVAVRAPLAEDKAVEGLPREEALAQAPAKADGQFAVPRFVEG
jgi:aspartyl-tRNA(Asn)/glutamyl-tRNA(Gln) amidotransferase subunit C